MSRSNDRDIHVKRFYGFIEKEQIILKLRIRMAEERRRQNLVSCESMTKIIVEHLKRNSTKLYLPFNRLFSKSPEHSNVKW